MTLIRRVLAFALLFPVLAVATEETPSQRAVLITGATSGIGLNMTRHLAANGFHVYAGARKDEDMASLNAMDNVEAVRLDVTYPEHIAAAVGQIRNGGRGLYGIVNNAGVASIGPLAETDIAELEWLFDINVYGPYRITQAFVPLLLESRGRVINISSISGILSGGGLGIYSMSKHALEAYTDSLAVELAPLGVHVSAIEPGNFNSSIGQTVVDRFDSGNIDLDSELFGDRLRNMADNMGDRSRFPEPDAVSAAALDALTADVPQRRYMVTPSQREAEITIQKAIEELVQLNGDHAHSYARDDLVRMLDEILQRERLAREGGGS